MLSPICYYGGKAMMKKHILPLIPQHEKYTESFFGGGSIFWAKEPSKVEIINDINKEVYNFWKQLNCNFIKLKEKINNILYSRDIYKYSQLVYNNALLFSDVERACAFWVLCNMSFVASLNCGFSYDKNNEKVKKVNSKKQLDEIIFQRLKNVCIENKLAHKIIEFWDSENTFHYIDPPYMNANQGHYSGYTELDFKVLLDTISNIKGKFLLSCYKTEMLIDYIKENKWVINEYDMCLSSSKVVNGKKKRKTECLVANYDLLKKPNI